MHSELYDLAEVEGVEATVITDCRESIARPGRV